MILIVDCKNNSWNLYHPTTLKEVKTGHDLPRIAESSVQRVGVVVAALPGGEELTAYHENLNHGLSLEELKLIKTLRSKFNHQPVYLLSDSAFFRSLPITSFRYLINLPVVRTGRDGLTHNFLLDRASLALGKSSSELNVITLFLDNESTMTAIKDGIAIETSSGLTSLEGLPGAASAGSVDGGVIFNLLKDMSQLKAERMLKSQSGILGFAGLKGDLEHALTSPKIRSSAKFQLALKIYLHRVLLYLGAYSFLLGRVDAVVISGVIGEKSKFIQAGISNGLGSLRYTNFLTIPARPHLLAAEMIRRLL